MMHFLAEDEDLSAQERQELGKVLARKDRVRGGKND